ncbi:unnamed protein product [Penicillium salamii]|nr:unnamed protein product [Penicillium salamii]
MYVLRFLQCFGVPKRPNVTTTENPCAQTMMNLHSECTIVSVPPGLENSMEFSRAGKTDATQSQVVKVWSINYTFIEGFKTPFIDTLEVEMASKGAKTVTKNKTYTDVIRMNGGKDAVAEFGPVFCKGVNEAEQCYIYGH